jgi:hypothetical protein
MADASGPGLNLRANVFKFRVSQLRGYVTGITCRLVMLWKHARPCMLLVLSRNLCGLDVRRFRYKSRQY